MRKSVTLAAAMAVCLCAYAAVTPPLSADGPATQPATRPATQPAAGMVVKDIRKADDTVTAAQENGQAVVTVVSTSGIGSATLECGQGGWPAKIVVRLRYAGRGGFTRLEGFQAWLMDDKDRRQQVEHRIVQGEQGVTVELSSPAGTALRRLRMEWIDAYR